MRHHLADHGQRHRRDLAVAAGCRAARACRPRAARGRPARPAGPAARRPRGRTGTGRPPGRPGRPRPRPPAPARSMASSSIASAMSPEVAQWASAAAATSDSARRGHLAAQQRATTAPFSAAGLPGSDSARRSAVLVIQQADHREQVVREPGGHAGAGDVRRVQPVEEVGVGDSAGTAHAHRLPGGNGISGRTVRADGPAPGDTNHWLDTSSSSRKRSTIRLCRAWSVERLAHDPAGQLGGQRPDLGAQRGQRLLPLGLDLGLGRLGHPAGFGLGLLAHLGDNLRALLPGLLAQPGRLVPGLGQLLPVLLEQLVGLGLRLFATWPGRPRSPRCGRPASC